MILSQIRLIGLYEDEIQLIVDALRDRAEVLSPGERTVEYRALRQVDKRLRDLATRLEECIEPEVSQPHGPGGFTY